MLAAAFADCQKTLHRIFSLVIASRQLWQKTHSLATPDLEAAHYNSE
jgi:hypothetical protein